MGFGIQGFEFRVWGLVGVRVESLGFWVLGLVSGLVVRVEGLGSWVRGFGFCVSGVGSWVQGRKP